MKLWSGIITEKLNETKDFYIKILDAKVVFESDWFVLLSIGEAQLGLMLPNLASQAPMFQPPLSGPGMWLALDVADVDEHYYRLRAQGVDIALDIKDEPWGDRHFAVLDPNGIGIDFVQHLGA